MIQRSYKKVPIPEYRIYNHIKDRCNNPNDKAYRHYGGRGIEIKFKTFDEFYESVGQRPSLKHSIDRLDNDGHYEDGNLRWATKREQNLNQRIRKDNTSGYRGVTRYLGNSPRKWLAYIRTNGKRLHIGNFGTPQEAAYVRDQFALVIYGENYNFNLLEKGTK